MSNAPLKKIGPRVAAGLLAAVSIAALAAGPSSAERSEEPGAWQAADAGSLGVPAAEPAGSDLDRDIWCLIDAGSLGVPNPIEFCG